MFSRRLFINSTRFVRQIGTVFSNNIPKSSKNNITIDAEKTGFLKNLTPFSPSFRCYAKGKDRKKENKGKGKVFIDEIQLSEIVNVESLKRNMQHAVTHLEEEFIKTLSLRSTTGTIESLPVSVDGKEHTLQEIAQIVRKNPKTVIINMAAFPQYLPDVLKAIQKSGMNLNPQQDGNSVFIPIPKVTKEHRENLAKNAKQLFVKCKTDIRDIQMKNVKQIKKKDKVSEDLIRNVEQQLTALADSFITEAEQILERKQQELLGGKD